MMSSELGNESSHEPEKRRFVWSKKLTIITASVAAAALVTAGAVVTVDQVTRVGVPAISGKTLIEARTTTGDAGLQLTVDEDSSDGFCVGDDVRADLCAVTSQAPDAGKRVHADQPVTVVLMPVKTSVPMVVGKTYQDARAELKSAGFGTLALDDAGPGYLSWKVLSQDESAQATAGSVIHLVLEHPLVKGPDVVGMSVVKAVDALNGAGFDVTGNEDTPMLETDSSVSQKKFDSAFVVTGTDPAIKDGKYPAGTVTLTWGMRVPKLVGMEGWKAEELLEALGLEEGFDSENTDRTIVKQKPKAGAKIGDGDEVNIFGEPPTIVYEVTGNGSRASITWIPPDSFNIAQDTNASLPWKKTWETDGDYGNFSAQAMNGTQITCSIYVNDEKVRTSTSNGMYSIASCG